MLKILLADDETAERNGIKFLINKFGLPLEVHEAANGKASYEYIKSNNVDILLTDIKMPFLNGLELAKKVRINNPKIKIIIFSAYGEFDYAKKAIEVKALNYILKPIEVDEFKSVMDKVINLCLEDKRHEEQDKTLKETFLEVKKNARNKILAMLIKSPEIQKEQFELIKSDFPSFEGHSMTLINFNTHSNFFNKNESDILKSLKSCLSFDFEYVNLSPNESYAVIYSRSNPQQDELLKCCTKINKSFRLENGTDVSVVIGTSFHSIYEFPKKVHEIESVMADLFYSKDSVVSVGDISNIHKENLPTANKILNKIESSISKRDLDGVSKNVEELINHLESQPAISAIYTRYIFWDIFKKLYNEFEVAQNVIDSQMDILLKSENLDGLRKVICETLNDLKVKLPNEETAPSKVVDTVIRIINTEYKNDLSLGYLAKRVYLTSSYLSYLFKQQTGETIVKYINNYRMEKAKEMLEGGAMKIIDVCHACGFENPSYFNYQFRICFGVTPKQYREQKIRKYRKCETSLFEKNLLSILRSLPVFRLSLWD